MTELNNRMDKAIESLRQNFTTVRTGRANPELLAKVRVECYGALLPIKQTASIHVQDNSTLVISPFDRSTMVDIEKGIMKADLGLNPINDGQNIRISIPLLTEERRKELEKVARKMAEDARIAIRNIRRDFMEDTKKNKTLTEDDHKRHEQEIQKTTDRFMATIDDLLKYKEKEIMEI